MRRKLMSSHGLSLKSLRLFFILTALLASISGGAQDIGVFKTSKTAQTTRKQAVRDASTKSLMIKDHVSPQFQPVTKNDPIPAGKARITLTAGDIWGDGSGYQLLMGTGLFGTIIPETGALTASCPASEGFYDNFTYKIPTNADGDCGTANIIINNSVSIDIPAGTYDYCVANPTPGDRIWIGNNGRGQNFAFQEGVSYVFSVVLNGQNDAVTLDYSDSDDTLTPYLRYCTDNVDSGVGTNSANTFSAAITFPVSALSEYVGTKITTIKVGIPDNFTDNLSEMSVWIRNTVSGVNLVSKTATFGTGWTSVDLDSEFIITGEQPLAIGYTLTTTGGYPLGASSNTPNATHGGHIAIGDSWTTLSASNISGNNTIIALVDVSTEPSELPGKVTSLTVVPGANGALNAEISFNTPSTTATGEAISSLTKIDVLRDGSIIKTFDAPAVGSALSHSDIVTENGQYTYSVIASNEAGEGAAVSKSAYVGIDVPAAPASITVTKDGVNGIITWVAPVTGAQGGYIAPETLTYKVVRTTDNVVLTENATSTTFTDTTIPTTAKYQYKVSAINAAGEGAAVTSTPIILGDFNISVPYFMGFGDDELYDTWVVIDDNEDGKTWTRDTANKCMRYSYHSTNTADDYLVSPKIPLEAGKQYLVSFKTRAMSSTFAERMELYLGTEQDLESIVDELWQEDVTYNTYKTISIDVTVDTSKEYTFLFKATSDPDKFYLYFDDFKIEEQSSVSGVITDGANPVAGVLVKVQGTEKSTYTAADGSYTLPLSAGTYVLETSKKGYKDGSFAIDVTEEGGSFDFAIEAYPLYSINGTVLGSDIQAGLEGATVMLSGYETYEVLTLADGSFTIPNVYGEQTYSLKITANGYSAYVEEIVVEDPISGLVVTLNEIAFPVMNLNVAVTSGAALITWEAPMMGEMKQYILDDGTAENGSAIAANYEASYGNLFSTSEAGVITGVDVYSMKNSNADGTRQVKVMIYNKDHELLGESQEFVFADNDWQTIDLPYVPFNGEFYAMVWFSKSSSRSNYIGLDEDGENASLGAFIRYEDGEWELTSTQGVFLIRANVISTGSSTYTAPATSNIAKRAKANVYAIESAFAAPVISDAVIADRRVEPKMVTLATGALYYNVYRGLSSEPTSAWTKLNAENVTGLSYTDANLGTIAPGLYRYGVEAIYTGGNASSMTASDEIASGLSYTVTVTESEGGSVTGAGTFAYGEEAVLSATANEYYYFKSWSDGVKENPRTIVVTGDVVIAAEFSKYEAPQNFVIEETGDATQRLVKWDMGDAAVEDDFEGHTAFTVNSAGDLGWSYIDGDGSATYTFQGVAFDNATAAMSYIVFNPSATSPVLTPADSPAIQPNSGDQFLACFAATAGPNNDWIISPELAFSADFTLSFSAKTYMSDYGLERMKVLYSTTGKAASDFTNYLAGSASTYVEVPVTAWTEYSYTVPAAAKYVAIQCVSNDAFVFMLDDISIVSGPSTMSSAKPASFNVFHNGEQAGNTYEMEYLLTNLAGGVTHTAGVQAVYADGVSEIVSDTFVTDATGIEGFTSETLNVYTEAMTIVISNFGDESAVSVFDTTGRGIAKKQATSGAEIRIPVAASGVYFVTVGDAKFKVLVP